MANYYDEVMNILTQKQIDAMPDYSRVQTAEGDPRIVGGFDEYGGKGAWSPIAAAEWGSGMPFGDDPSARIPTGLDASGVPQFTDPVGYRGYGLDRASVVNPVDSMYQSYNPAGAYAEAGRTVPNYESDWARGMNQVTQPFGGMGAGDRVGFPAPRDPQTGEDLGWMNQDERERFYRHQEQFPEGEDLGWMEASVVNRPRMPTDRIRTEQEELLSTQQGVENSDRAFSRLHTLWAQGHPFFSLDPDDTRQGYDTEGVGELPEFTEIYLQVPDEAKRYAHANKHDPKVLAQFEEKYGFPLDVSVEIIR